METVFDKHASIWLLLLGLNYMLTLTQESIVSIKRMNTPCVQLAFMIPNRFQNLSPVRLHVQPGISNSCAFACSLARRKEISAIEPSNYGLLFALETSNRV
jgi:hypothetical protein